MGVHFSLQYKKPKSDYLKTDELVNAIYPLAYLNKPHKNKKNRLNTLVETVN